MTAALAQIDVSGFEALSVAELVYVTIVFGIGAYALIRTLAMLGMTRRLRLAALEGRRRFDAVRTESPVDDPKQIALDRGKESIQSHFSVMRRLLVPTIVLVTLLLAAPAFLGGTSASTASMIGAVIAIVLGIALRPFLENAVAGLAISSSRLVRIGDTVRVDGWFGTIEDITTTHTAIKVWDWRRYLVPNSKMLQQSFFNYSLFDSYQWAYVEFWVSPEADLDVVREVAVAAPLGSEFLREGEEPKFWVIDIHKDAICCWIAAWAETPSRAWSLTHDVRTALLTELRRRGVPLMLQRFRGELGGADGPPGPPE